MRNGMVGRVEKGPARQFHKVRITLGVFRQQSKNAAVQFAQLAYILAHITEIDFETATDDRLNSFLRQSFGKLQCSEKIVGIGDSERGHSVRPGQFGKLLDGERTFGKRVSRMGAQMDEFRRGITHGKRISGSGHTGESTSAGIHTADSSAKSPVLSVFL